MKDMVKDITLKLFGVDDLHLRSQECPSVSGRIPDKCSYISFKVLGMESSVNRVGDITLKPFWVANLHLRSQEDPPMSGRVPDNCPYLSFYVLEIERGVTYQIGCIL